MVPGAPFTPLFKYLGPRQLRRFVLRLVPWSLLQRLVDIVNIMDSEAQNILKEQEKDIDAGVDDKDGKDIMGILRESKPSMLLKCECLTTMI